MHAPLGRAVLAGLLVLAGLGGVVAADQAASGPVLAIPAIHVGDRGEYAAALEYRDGTPARQRAGHWTGQTFEWHDGAIRTDEEGNTHAVRELETYTNATPGAGWTHSWAHWSIDASSGETVAVDKRWSNSGSHGLLSASGDWSNVGNTTSFGDGGTLCGMRSSLLGRSGPAPRAILLEGSCTDQAGLGPGGRSTFRLEGNDVVDGHLAHRYAPADGGSVRVWFASGVAAPVQILQPSVAMERVRDIMVRLRLVGWQAGTVEESLPAIPDGAVAKPLEWAPRDPLLGPAKGEMKHPFPHDAAWQVAMADSTSGLASFVSSHPDAFLTYLYGYTGFGGRGSALPTLTWDFVVTDGSESVAVRVVHTPNPRGLERLPLGVPDEVRTFSWETNPLWLPDPGQVQADDLPTIASLLERWSVLRGRAVPSSPVYGFAAICQVAGCTEVALWAFAGESTTEFTNGTSRGTWDTFFVDLNTGEVLLSRQDFEAATASPLGFGKLAPLTRRDDRPPAGVGTLATQWIASPAGAGTFAAALLVAALTYLWPTLKQGVLALFSRLTPAEIAGHPTRQAILDAVAASPGIHFQAICRSLGKGRGVVGHHLAKLVATGQVAQHRKGGFTCHFLTGQDAGSVAAVTALKAEGAQRLLRALLDKPDRSGLELADATGLSPSTVHYHLRRLQDAGLVVASARGRSLAMRATADGERAALAALGGVA